MSKSYWLFKNPYLRNWATPLTIGAFILTTVTGVLMFFELDQGLIAEVHEWCSWLFLLGCGGHIMANIHPLKNQLKTRWGKISLLMFTAVLAASFFSWGLITPAQLKRPIERALVEAPLSALAMVTHTDPGALIHRLKAHGIDATGNQSIRDLVMLHKMDENRLLGIVFLSE